MCLSSHLTLNLMNRSKTESYGMMNTIINLSSSILKTIVHYNSGVPIPNEYLDYIQTAKSQEDINVNDIEEYFFKLSQTFELNSDMIILSMMLLDKVLLNNPTFVLNQSTVHKLLFMSIMETLKYHEDICYSNKVFAQVGNFTIEELLLLEISFLSSIDYKMQFEYEDLLKYKAKLLQLNSKMKNC